jgi:hypothetical protein
VVKPGVVIPALGNEAYDDREPSDEESVGEHAEARSISLLQPPTAVLVTAN